MLAAYCRHPRPDDPPGSSLAALYELRSVARPSLRAESDGAATGGDAPSPSHPSGSLPSHYRYPPGTLLIRTTAASICGSDLFGIGGCDASPGWRRPTDLLKAMRERCGGSGHESVGVIVDLVPSAKTDDAESDTEIDSEADSSKGLQVGQWVLAMSSSYMFKVSKLRKAFEEETGQKLEEVFPEEVGAFCEYFISHSCVCIPLPEGVPRVDFDRRWYVMAQPLGTVLHAVQKLGSVVGLTIALVGQGQNGLIMSQMLANMGARRILALDLLEERLEYSKKNGATHTIRVEAPMNRNAVKREVELITEGNMCDVTVDMVGHQSQTMMLCSSLAKDGGRVLLFGLPPAKDEAPLSIRYVDLSRNLHFICSHSPELETFRMALELIERGRFDPSTIFSHEVPFAEFVAAYERACHYRDGVVKVLLTFPEREER